MKKKQLLLILISFSFLMGEFKNVQILKYDSEKDLKKYMKVISKDLVVKCSFCHDFNDKSIETKHKKIAREMIKMQNDLNEKNFSKTDPKTKKEAITQISCWTCHRGSKIPELIRPKG